LSGTTHTAAGDYPSDAWTFTDVTGNYSSSSGTTHDIINKATAVCTVTGYTVTYDGAAHMANGTCTGLGGVVLTGLDLSGTTHTAAGDYPSDAWSLNNANYTASGTTHDTINKPDATCTVTGYNVTYDGNSYTATGMCTGIGGVSLTGLDLSGTTHTNAGDYPSDTWSFTDPTGNYNSTSGTVDDSITKVNATCTVTGYTITYNGSSYTASGTCTGIGGASLSGLDLSGTTHTAAGDYPNDAWSFTDGDGNYNDANGIVHDSIAKANATCTVTPYNVPYDGNAHTANGICTGIAGENLSGLDLSGTTHTNMGDYPGDTWSFSDTAGNYNSTNGIVHDSIGKAAATCTVTGYTVNYDGSAHSATGSCTGIGGVSLNGLDLSGTIHTNAGDYPGDAWSFTDPTGNYSSASGTVHDSIGKVDVICTVTSYSVPYDGSSHTATGVCTGVTGLSLSGLDLSGTSHTAGGDYPNDGWTFSDSAGNYNSTSGTVHDSIAKVNATCTIAPYSVTYDGAAHTATGTCTGIGGVAVSGLDLSSTTHTTAGDYSSDAWTLNNANYTSSGTTHDIINKATATCAVTGYSVPYDGNAHAATGTCIGVGGVTLSGLDLSGTTHTNAGDYADDAWTFTDSTGNYDNTNGTVHDLISGNTATCTVNGYSGVYDGKAHGASGSCISSDGVTLSGLDLGISFTDVPGGTAHWVFSNASYNVQSGDVAIVITKTNATCTINGYLGLYTGTGVGANGLCTGVGGVTLSGLDLGSKFTDVPGGTAHWTFSNTDYNDQSGDAAIVINKAASNVKVNCPSSIPYTGSAQTPCSAQATGPGLNQQLTVDYNNNTDIGTATASSTYAGDDNHTGSSGSTTFYIIVPVTATPTIENTLTATPVLSALIPEISTFVPTFTPNYYQPPAKSDFAVVGSDLKAPLTLAEKQALENKISTAQPKTIAKASAGSNLANAKTASNKATTKNSKASSNKFLATYSGLFSCIGSGFLLLLIFFMFKRRRKEEDEEEVGPTAAD
jgi:hypothetical protein